MRLADWLSENDKTDSWLAEQVGRDRSFVTKLKNGAAAPSLATAVLIQRITEGAVTPNDFVDASAEPDLA